MTSELLHGWQTLAVPGQARVLLQVVLRVLRRSYLPVSSMPYRHLVSVATVPVLSEIRCHHYVCHEEEFHGLGR